MQGCGMAKENERVLPFLNKDTIRERDEHESVLDRDLSQCGGYDFFDVERAEHLLNAAVVSIFDVEYYAYREKPGYEPSWITHIMHEAAYRVVKQADNHYWKDLPSLYLVLEKTLLHHLRHDSILAHHDELEAALSDKKKSRPGKTSTEPAPVVASKAPPQPQVPAFAEELDRLLIEARWKPEDISEKIGIDPRNVYRHLSSDTAPTLTNVASYEAALTNRLGRPVKLPTPVKRQRASKTSAKRQ
jgi:hypothetical protein